MERSQRRGRGERELNSVQIKREKRAEGDKRRVKHVVIQGILRIVISYGKQ